MFSSYLKRGGVAGLAGGLIFGAYTGFIIGPLITVAETFEQSHELRSHGTSFITSVTTTTTSITAGILWGIFLGVLVFGVIYFFIEPLLPGVEGIKSYVIAGGGLLSLSGAPWLILPPQPPGADQSLPTDIRIIIYIVMIVVGVVTFGLSISAWRRLDNRLKYLGAALPIVILVFISITTSVNPITTSLPTSFVALFQAIVTTGQLILWSVTAIVHAKLTQKVKTQINESADKDRAMGT